MSDELKRCPFCGKEHEFVYGRVYFGHCLTREDWNIRPIEDELTAEISHLTSELTNGRELLAMALAEGDRLNAEIESLRLQLELYQDYE